jgi:K+-transporting ATPase c subunit
MHDTTMHREKSRSASATTVTQMMTHTAPGVDAKVMQEAAAMYRDAVARMKDSSFICILQVWARAPHAHTK